MCNFCNSLEYREIKIPTRTAIADDNICDFVSPDKCSCENCYGCSEKNNHFSITTWEDNLCVNYYHKIKNVVIAPVSSRFSINYCPMCGKRISDKFNEVLKFW